LKEPEERGRKTSACPFQILSRENTHICQFWSRETDMYSVIGTLNKAQAERVKRRGRIISSMFWILSREARYICHFKQRDRH
jgi:hypothetical protein